MTSRLKNSQFAEVVPEGAFTDASFVLEKGFGEEIDTGKIWLFPEEALFLAEKGKLKLKRTKEITSDQARRFFSKHVGDFLQKYAVYSDLRTIGYVVKSGAKYGADFRIYEKGVKPSRLNKRSHSKYLVWVLSHDDFLEMKNLVGINRVAHSVKKRLVFAIVDKEMDVVYLQNTRLLM
ncbi:MAG: tRNA-intron lyase [Candidatus Altiarchaeota archaeon]|nr:tRNA-intron lyase [Candidatus Altiarchaeota archaeon]